MHKTNKFLKLLELNLEKLNKWWEGELKRIDRQEDYLVGRIVYCATCGDNSSNYSYTRSTLWRYQGRMVCSNCCSDSWVYPTTIRPALNDNIENEMKELYAKRKFNKS